MTVCLAATFRYAPYRRAFMLCTDGRLDEGAWGLNDSAFKVHNLGHNFMGMMSGNWPTVRELCSRVENDQRERQIPKDADEVVTRFESSVHGFTSSRLCTGDACVLVTGFLGKNPLLLKISIEDKVGSVDVVHDLDAIGEGAFAALTLLRYRGYDPLNTPLNVAAYLLYEAKRFSECVGSVGPKTRLKIHRPLDHPGFMSAMEILEGAIPADQYNWRDISPEEIAQLENVRAKAFLQQIPDFAFSEDASW